MSRSPFFGKALRGAIKEAGLSVEALAHMSAVSPRAVYGWMAGERLPNAAWLQSLSDLGGSVAVKDGKWEIVIRGM